jgi:glycosyltransferase involved in cell wall biosynthesis
MNRRDLKPTPVRSGPHPRLIVVSHSREVGGAEVYVENLTRHLARQTERAWSPELICRRDAAVDSLAQTVAEWAPVSRLDFGRLADVREIRRRMASADLVHLNLSYPAGKYPFGAAILARSLGRPLVVTHHLALDVGVPWRQLMRWLGKQARHIAVSHHAAEVLMREYEYPPESLQVIHNGIDAQRFHPADPEVRLRLRRRAGEMLDGQPWGDDVLVSCTVARLSPQKGLFELVDAAAQLSTESLNIKMVVIGEGELRRALTERVRERGLENRLFLIGSLPQNIVAEWLAASDLFVLPSRYEGGPATALMEAMACSCAVVATNVSGVSELVTDDSLGRLVPARDAQALAASIRELIADAELRAKMADRARAKVLAEFTIDASMRRTEAVLETVASSSTRSQSTESVSKPR